MRVTIESGKLSGRVRAVSSKSQAHRVLFCAAFSDRDTLIKDLIRSDDIDTTIRSVVAIGAEAEEKQEGINIKPVNREKVFCSADCAAEARIIDIGESGTTLRFLLPLLGIDGIATELKLRGRLAKRPMGELLSELSEKGMEFELTDRSLFTQNRLSPGTYKLPGNVSSQYISALLTALPLLNGESSLKITGSLSSAGYVDMTLDVLRMFGADIQPDDHTYLIKPVERYRSPGEIRIEGDWSAGAYWITAQILGSNVTVDGLSDASYQPDRAVKSLLPQIMAGNAEIDVDACPDLLPVLAVAAAGVNGQTRFVNAARLRAKESDRLDTTEKMIMALGGLCETDENSLTVTGNAEGLTGGTVEAFGDHRIAMSAAVASTICRNTVTINGADAVSKSYPDFWKDFLRCTTQSVTITE